MNVKVSFNYSELTIDLDELKYIDGDRKVTERLRCPFWS